MIGPSETAGKTTENQCCLSSKRKIFDELDIDSYCEEIPQTNHKRCLQELDRPVELVSTSNEIIANATALFSPMSGQEVFEEPVTRLEVLLVDGTNCTWTTVSELEQNLDVLVTSSSSSLSSPSVTSSGCTDHYTTETYIVEETKHQSSKNYWEPVAAPTLLLTNSNMQYKNHTPNNYQQQQQQQQQQFEDQENGNLSWLLDFKLDSFIEAADRPTMGSVMTKDNHCGNKNKPNGRLNNSNGREIRRGNHENLSMYKHDANQATYPINEINTGNFSSSRSNGLKKPPFTYTELIEHALQERGELTVSAIYQWISEHFPYYKSNDDRWKNSVRHNLSINPHFRKGSKAPHGAGHLWAIANRSDCRPRPLDVNVLTATARQVAQNVPGESQSNENVVCESMAEVEIATASIAQPNYEDNDIPNDNISNDIPSVTLEDSAEQILNGVKREVEVQYLVPMAVTDADHEMNQQNQEIAQETELQCFFKETDFLHTVSKEDVAVECGLSEEYVVTDLNPNALGLNLVDSDIIEPENLFGEELSFQFYELTSSQLQSA